MVYSTVALARDKDWAQWGHFPLSIIITVSFWQLIVDFYQNEKPGNTDQYNTREKSRLFFLQSVVENKCVKQSFNLNLHFMNIDCNHKGILQRSKM